MTKKKTISPDEAEKAGEHKSKYNYKKIPALCAYIDRIGAEESNFRTFIVKEYKAEYYTERATIKIMGDCSIRSSKAEYAPSKEEALAIKNSLIDIVAAFPKSIKARNIDKLKGLVYQDSPLYQFIDRDDGGQIVFVQERRITKGGQKYYLPWTFFSDGEWRNMEPDGGLPFWRPSQKRSPRIMIHEGPKTASFVEDLCTNPDRKEELDAHPWGKFICDYEHWGLMGGALAPHRTDFSVLRRENPIEVVYVCDNDYPGKSALPVVSSCYGRSMKGVMFDDDFTNAWDMADPIPDGLYNEEALYKGKMLKELMIPATMATEIDIDENGKSHVKLRRVFCEEWFHCVTPEAYIHKDFPHRVLSDKEFNNNVSPYSHSNNTALMLKKDAASKSCTLKYCPAMDSGVYGSGESGRYINTHFPSRIVAEKGDIKPFLDFMAKLIPEENDRIELMRWCATLIVRPDIKMLYGVLLISEVQGVGKGTLGEKILTPLIGVSNVSKPSEQEIVDSNYNYWLAHKRLAVIHEIYAGHSSKAYNKLKSVITDDSVTVSKKYQAHYDVDNWMHIFACSNSLRAIQLSSDDRRWFVPRVIEAKQTKEYWIKFNHWLTEQRGLQIIKWWATEFLKKYPPVRKGEDAPSGSLKKEVIEEGYSPGQLLVARTLDRIKGIMDGEDSISIAKRKTWEGKGQLKDGKLFVTDTDLQQLIKDVIYEGRHSERLERPATIRKVAKAQGWYIGAEKAKVTAWGHRNGWARIICSSGDLASHRPSDLCSEKIEPKDCFFPLDLKQFSEI